MAEENQQQEMSEIEGMVQALQDMGARRNPEGREIDPESGEIKVGRPSAPGLSRDK